MVDEFQVLVGVDFGAMLAELRKFGASFALATQALAHLDALDKALRPTVMANVDQLFCYAVSADDARVLERELDGTVEATDLITLDDFTCYARLTVHGRRTPVFSLTLDPPTPPNEAQQTQAEALRWRSQRRIGCEAGAVETLIVEAAQRRKVLAEEQQKQPGSPPGRRRSQDARRDRMDGRRQPVRRDFGPSSRSGDDEPDTTGSGSDGGTHGRPGAGKRTDRARSAGRITGQVDTRAHTFASETREAWQPSPRRAPIPVAVAAGRRRPDAGVAGDGAGDDRAVGDEGAGGRDDEGVEGEDDDRE